MSFIFLHPTLTTIGRLTISRMKDSSMLRLRNDLQNISRTQSSMLKIAPVDFAIRKIWRVIIISNCQCDFCSTSPSTVVNRERLERFSVFFPARSIGALAKLVCCALTKRKNTLRSNVTRLEYEKCKIHLMRKHSTDGNNFFSVIRLCVRV